MTDHDLMAAVRDGDCDSLGGLFERHHRKLYNYFLKHTGNCPASEDMVQEVFLRILKYRRSYQGAEGGFTIWLYRIARNVRFDYYRRRDPVPVSLEDGEIDIPDNGPGPDGPLEAAENTALLRRALDALPDEKRELIIMSKYQEMKYRDIGRVLGCTENTVKVRVFRAVRELADRYAQLTGETCHEM